MDVWGDVMAKLAFKGLDEWAMKLSVVVSDTEAICGAAIYDMADIVADSIRKNLEALEAVPDTEALEASRKGAAHSLTVSEKKGLENSLGISPMQCDDGYYNVKVGFDGYNEIKTKLYPKGQPNVMIARATESGSSVREKTPFIAPALKASKKAAIEAGRKRIDEELEKRMK